MGTTAIAFDFGTKSIGCAVGQSITGTAQALPAFKAQDGIPNWDAIEKCLKDWKPDVIVVGLPLNMDGTEQDLTLRAKKFANRLNGRFGIKVELQDERLTTVSARDEIFQRGGYRALNKCFIYRTVQCYCFSAFDMTFGCVEMRISRDNISFMNQIRE